MRGTFIAGLLLLGATGVYYTAKQLQKSGHGLSITSQLFTSKSSSQKRLTRFKGTKKLHQGEQHESTSHRSRQQVESEHESVSSEEGASSSFEQAQSLPSIYQTEEPEHSGSALSLKEEIGQESNEETVEHPKEKVVYGIPIASWLKQQKNRLAPKVEPVKANGMRFIINCVELKKAGTEALNQRECKEIAVSREKSRGAALIQ
jgi:hypothetical protein